jgi:hypothetical protein
VGETFLTVATLLLVFLSGMMVGWLWGFFNGKNRASKLLDVERAQLETGFDVEKICREVNNSPEFQAACKKINDRMRAEVEEYNKKTWKLDE